MESERTNQSVPTELIEYVVCPLHDALMAQWFARLCACGDVEKLFRPSAHTLSGFFNAIAQPTTTIFKVNDQGIWFVAMLTPHFAGASFDMWVAPNKRKGKAWVQAMCEALEYGFARYPVLMGLTAQENLLDDHVRMGYVVLGKVPALWDGEAPLWAMYITKETFDARETYIIRRAS